MRLTRCHLNSVRRHKHLALDFAPGLTLITGSNESGKSSLVEALHRTLFLRATATGTPVQRLRSLIHSGHPEVQVDFEARGQHWTLHKRFSGQSGTTRLSGQDDSPRMGSEAEEHLATLLGIDEIVGSRQAGRVLPSRWAHLWVMQGEAGKDLLQLGGDHYDLRGLIAQLENQADAALQSPLDQQLHDQLNQLVSASLTSRGIRHQSRLWHCAQELKERQQHCDDAAAALKRYEQTSAELDTLDDQLQQLQETQLPQLKLERSRRQTDQTELERALAQRTALEQQRKPLALQRQQLQLQHQRLQQTEQVLERKSKTLKEIELELEQLVQSQTAAAAAVDKQIQQRNEIDERRQELEQRGQQLRRLEEHLQLNERLEQLRAQERLQNQWNQQNNDLTTALAHVTAPGMDELQHLLDQQRKLEAVTIRLDAMASVVTLETSDQAVLLDGSPLHQGESERRATTFSLTVGEGVKLQISPGGGEGLGALKQDQHTLQQDLNDALQRWEAPSLVQLSERSKQRQELITRQTLLQQQRPESGDRSGLRQEQISLEQRLQELVAEIGEQPSAPVAGNTIADQLATCRQRYREINDQGKALRLQLEQQQHQLNTHNQQRQRLELQREALVAETRTLHQQRRDLIRDQGDAATLLKALEQLETEINRLNSQLEPLVVATTTAAASAEAIAKQLKEFDQQEQTLQERLQGLSVERGALLERTNSLGQEDPYGRLEEAKTLLQQAETSHREESLQVRAHQHLLGLFEAARRDLSSRYTAPLSTSISNFLSPLVEQITNSCQLNYDTKQGLGDLTLQREGLTMPFANLSGGMKEQLNAALRLAMADTLRVGHDGCLPLLFDDAFTNTDPERLQGVLAMLRQAVSHGLQVVVLSCDGDPYRSIADAVVELN